MDRLVREETPVGAPESFPTEASTGRTQTWSAPSSSREFFAQEPPSPELGRYLGALVEARRRIALFTFGAAIAAAALALLLPRYWTARVVLLPGDEGDGAFPAQLSGLVSSFGLPMSLGPASASDLYPTILTSDRLLGGLLDQSFRPEPDAAPLPLLHILGEDDDDHRARMKAVRRLRRKVVTAAKDGETGIVSLEVTTRDPALSADVANALTAQLEQYLIDSRQQEGRKNRTFIDERLAEVSKELAAAESRLTEFQDSNRRIGSPDLLLEQARLQREMMIQEQVFLELQKQKEIAEIEEVKNTPVLEVLDVASAPIRPSKPIRSLLVCAGALLGAFVATSWVLVRTSLGTAPDVMNALAPLASDLRGIVPKRRARRAAHAK